MVLNSISPDNIVNEVDLLCRFSAISQSSELDSSMFDAEGNAHSYTNIEFACEKAHGTFRRMKGTFGEGSNR